MLDIASIGTVFSSLKTATDLAKVIKDSGLSLEQAEVKFQMAELISALADAKIELVDIQDVLREKDSKIKELENSFHLKSEVKRVNDAYYHLDENGKGVGNPNCLNCWETKQRLYPLHYEAGNRHAKACTACKTKYEARMVAKIIPETTKA
jgi:hypothetical protein